MDEEEEVRAGFKMSDDEEEEALEPLDDGAVNDFRFDEDPDDDPDKDH